MPMMDAFSRCRFMQVPPGPAVHPAHSEHPPFTGGIQVPAGSCWQLLARGVRPSRWLHPLFSRLGPCRFMQAAPGQLRTPSFPSMIIKQALEAGAGVDVKMLNYHRNGSAMWNQLAVVPLRSADGSVTHHVGMQVGQQLFVAASLQSKAKPGCQPCPRAVAAQPQQRPCPPLSQTALRQDCHHSPFSSLNLRTDAAAAPAWHLCPLLLVCPACWIGCACNVGGGLQ